MAQPFKKFLYGGDYYPNQWSEDIWQEDMRYFKEAHVNSTTINNLSWAAIQLSENSYDFSELDKIVAMLSKEDSQIVMSTPTGAMPAWLVGRYPEVSRVDFEGRRHKFGFRHNACPNSLVYQKYSEQMAYELAKRYADNPNIVCWHINNEYGGECYCEKCEKAFRVWLKDRYQTLDKLNDAWNTGFWGHTIYDWDEIVVPNLLSEARKGRVVAFQGIAIDYCRFNSDGLLENFKLERDAIRSVDPNALITTNLMGAYKPLDYFKWAKEIDIISEDSYPSYNTPWSLVAMEHDLMRGLKKQTFMLMEQTPSQQNWQPYNSLKQPGKMRAQSYQTVAHGSDTVQFFQLRRSKGACEKFHGALIEHAGTTNTRVFREVSALGKELEGLTDLMGAKNVSKVGMIFDWDNYWALEYTSGPNKDLTYIDQLHQYYRYFYERNISVDMISDEDDLAGYSMVVAPVFYMVKEGRKDVIENFVKKGGVFVTTFMSGIVDESDNVHLGGYPGPLRKLAGVWVEEIDALAPEQVNQIKFADGTEGTCSLLCDIMHLEGATVLAEYASHFYKGTPAITRNAFGEGCVFYMGTQLDQKGLAKILDQACETIGITDLEPNPLEIVQRETETDVYEFMINFSNPTQPLPSRLIGLTNELTGKKLTAEDELKQYDVILTKTRKV